MKLFRMVAKQGLLVPVAALVFVSFVCAVLVAYRIIVGCEVRHGYLVWNLFLAWLPLGFALLAAERLCSGTGILPVRCGANAREDGETEAGLSASPDRRDACPTTQRPCDRTFLAWSTAWLLFFPNAPYIFTDLVHVLATERTTFWSELMLILIVALTGLMAGFLSLQIMHGLATRSWGCAAGWLFVAGVSGLAGFGVYLGRFTRLNSWDVLLNPVRLVRRSGWGAWNLLTEWQHTKFLILFSLFLLLGYLMLFALTRRGHATATFRDLGVE